MQCVLLQCSDAVNSSIRWRCGGRCPRLDAWRDADVECVVQAAASMERPACTAYNCSALLVWTSASGGKTASGGSEAAHNSALHTA